MKISKSARFRRQFRRHDEEEAKEDKFEEMSHSSLIRHLSVLTKLTNPGRHGNMTVDSRSGLNFCLGAICW